jgi:hypothetical protein
MGPRAESSACGGQPGRWHVAVGPWRAFYRVDGDVIRIVAFRHRAIAHHELKGS